MDKVLLESKIIPREYHGQRLDAVLAQLYPDYSRSQLTSWLKAGAIMVHYLTKPKDKVVGGERIHIASDRLPPFHVHTNPPDRPEALTLNIVYEDDQVLIINKAANVVVHPGAGNPNHTLVNALLYHQPALQHLPRAGMVHRLDKDTTGLLIVAKTPAVHTDLVRQMQARTIQRAYLTLVQGHLIASGKIDTFFGRHPHNRLKMAVCQQGRQAITSYTICKQYQDYTLLDVQLLTGRTHQIRVHMAHLNHPIVGDPLYGGRIRFPAQASPELRQILQQFHRQALHAATLSFYHSAHQKQLTFTAPLPEDFQNLLNALDIHFAEHNR